MTHRSKPIMKRDYTLGYLFFASSIFGLLFIYLEHGITKSLTHFPEIVGLTVGTFIFPAIAQIVFNRYIAWALFIIVVLGIASTTLLAR